MKSHNLIFSIAIAWALITASCNAPATRQSPPPEQPTITSPNAPSSLFKLVKSVDVTPVGNGFGARHAKDISTAALRLVKSRFERDGDPVFPGDIADADEGASGEIAHRRHID